MPLNINIQPHNKLVLASQMFVEAHDRFAGATRDIDYVASLMLSGAVVGIVAPLLVEQGKPSTHQLLAELFEKSHNMHEGMFRAVYSGLKHAGKTVGKKRGGNIAPSNDLILLADLRIEAAEMLEAAHEDFGKIQIDPNVRPQLPQKFIDLISSPADYT